MSEINFPFQMFNEAIRENLLHIGSKYNIPPQFMGCAAIAAVAGLAGNMYRLQTDQGVIKPNLFMAMVAPSGVGKTPAYQSLCGRPTAKLRFDRHQEWKESLQRWRIDHGKDSAKGEFTPPKPNEILRIFEEGTSESIEDALTYCRAGLTLVYDEGQKFFSSAMAYKKDANADGFWNDLFEGNTTYRHRVAEDNRRFIPDPCVSVLIGLQTERMAKYFTEDTIYSGIFNRFLFVFSKRIQLNTDISLNSENGVVCEDWRSLVQSLFQRGFRYDPDSEGSSYKTIWVTVDPESVDLFDRARRMLITESNVEISAAQDGEASGFMTAYNAKLYKYFMKFCIILAILDDHINPVIRHDNIKNAGKLYRFFKANVAEFLGTLVETNATGLTPKESAFLNLLPELFDASHIKTVTEQLGCAESFFRTAMCRKFANKWVKKLPGNKNYEKI
jgi:hypothetical protein